MKYIEKIENFIFDTFKANLIKNMVLDYRKKYSEETMFLTDEEIYMMNPLTETDIDIAANVIVEEYRDEIKHLQNKINERQIFSNDIPDAQHEIIEYEIMIMFINNIAKKMKDELNGKRSR